MTGTRWATKKEAPVTEQNVIPALDMFGRELKEGDYIAYALTIDRSAKMGVYQVEALVPTECWGVYKMPGDADWRHGAHVLVKIKAKQLEVSYGSLNSKQVTLGMAHERAVRLDGKGPWK